MAKGSETICVRFGRRLGLFKKKANVSYAKIHYITLISENHIKNTIAGNVNIGLLHLEIYANFFGVKAYQMLDDDGSIPDRATLQQNISNYIKESGFDSSDNFKKLGPSYLVEEYIQEFDEFSEPLEAGQITTNLNKAKGTSYKTNNVSKVLKNLADEGVITRIDTGNTKKPKYGKMKNQ